MFARLAGALAGNAALVRRNAQAPLTIAVHSGPEAWTVRTGGEAIAAERGAAAAGAAFTLTAAPETWHAFAQAVPAVGYQSLVAMQRVGHLKVDGDMLQYGRNMLFLEELFRALRPPKSAEKPAAIGEAMIEPVLGRYLRLDLNGRPHRIYFEEAGQGIPLLCLHTAGADGRQFRALLNDAEITSRFRVIAFDLPWHGKSSPPPGFEREHYRLTTDLYVDTVMAVARGLKLDRPVS